MSKNTGTSIKDDILDTLEKFGRGNEKKNESDINQQAAISHPLEEDLSDCDVDNYFKETKHSTFTSYCEEWQRLFGCHNYMSVIKKQGFNGNLRSSRFRSVCWRLYLDCLPEDQCDWIEKVRESRQIYSDIKDIHITNPRNESKQDVTVHHPLSLDEQSPWNKFFQDNELRHVINQDVKRTFPEIQFFQTQEVRDMMVNILFCYARENEELSYKQGMHELLAPIIFVLHCDHQAFLHATEMESLLEVVKELLNPDYIEHDAYALFVQLMETMEPWYRFGRPESRSYFQGIKNKIMSATPFTDPSEFSPSSPVVTKLTKIQDRVLQKYDYELYLHLSRLEIAPQIYGIRWVRLLFGREFPLQDLLVLWDAIFADGLTFDLIDYIFVAMLMYVREQLLSNDYPGSLKTLMRYPPVTDVHFLLNQSLYLRKPKDRKKPSVPVYNFSYPKIDVAGQSKTAPSQSSTQKPKPNKVSVGIANITKRIKNKTSDVKVKVPKSTSEPSSISEAGSEAVDKSVKAKTLPSRGSGTMTPLDNVTPGTGKTPQSDAASKKTSIFGRPRSFSRKNKEEEELQHKLSIVQGEYNDLQDMCMYCSTKMESLINNVQKELTKEKLQREDEIMLAIAGLKQVRDILKGTLKFSRNLLDDEDEIVISDDHYGLNLDGESSDQSADQLETVLSGDIAVDQTDQSSVSADQSSDQSETALPKGTDSTNSQDFVFLDGEPGNGTASQHDDALECNRGDKLMVDNSETQSAEINDLDYSILNIDGNLSNTTTK
uniref:TBC1 domain family member 5-like isoform X1 n=1 Tax=Saccoglossus kowalevskii TaxID=10224 RepID=A0ABM0MV60_SACKO|nr:PREDICTED: TBC1 domain family member 5-like isoform X1 [Saccoglossus kowalevskii]XP_006823901.1 PREDICTED: TBC1 domain family member 5-like isoform X2 [Saccoglossus kowalevskii]